MSIPSEAYGLVERFDRERASYVPAVTVRPRRGWIPSTLCSPCSAGTSRTNKAGRGLPVVYEDRVKVGAARRPRITASARGERRFFLEAKKPSVDLAGT